MSEEEKVVPPVVAEKKPVPAVVVDPEKEPEKDPAWVGKRLDRARGAWMKEMGIDDPEQAKAAIAAGKAAADAKKSAEEKAAELTTKLTAADAERNRLLAITQEHAARMIGVLTAAQQKAVKDIAGDDPALQLKAIASLGPTWAREEPATPASTAPAATAPAAVVPGAPPDHKTEYKTLKTSNPFAAAAYGLKNEVEVYK